MKLDDKIYEISKGRPIYLIVMRRRVIIPLAIVAVVFLAWMIFGASAVASEVVKRIRCSSFEYQEDAQVAYWQGATWLDGNDKDKKACEFLPRLTK